MLGKGREQMCDEAPKWPIAILQGEKSSANSRMARRRLRIVRIGKMGLGALPIFDKRESLNRMISWREVFPGLKTLPDVSISAESSDTNRILRKVLTVNLGAQQAHNYLGYQPTYALPEYIGSGTPWCSYIVTIDHANDNETTSRSQSH